MASENCPDENKECLERSVVAKVQNVHSIPTLQTRILSQQVSSIKVSPMGGDQVLLTFDNKELMEEFLAEKCWLQQWFVEVNLGSQFTHHRRG